MEEEDFEKITEHVEYDNRCGIGACKPKAMQTLANIQAFVGFYSVISSLTQMLTSYLGSQIPSIEKQFGLSSSYSGLLMSFNDIGYLSLCLFASTLTKYIHIPRWLFGCFVVYGMSGILCGLPHFISAVIGGLPSLSADSLNNSSEISSKGYIPLCPENSSSTENCGHNPKVSTGSVTPAIRTMFLVLFGTGMTLQGAAKSVRGPFITVYIDDEGDKKKTGFYAGIIVCVTIFGPVLSYVFGGLFSKMYVTLEDVDFGPRDPRWIGAWWLGFTAFGACAIVLSIPLLFFPRHLKPPQDDIPRKKSARIKDRALSFCRVLKNPVYLSQLCAEIIGAGSFAATFAFLSKYISTQFTIPLWNANMIMAVANVSSLAFGSFVGGFITKRMELTPRRNYGLIIIVYAIHVLLFTLGLILGCHQPTLFGPDSNGDGQKEANSKILCTSACDCDEDKYFPVCGSNGINYYSPCYAGCGNVQQNGQSYTNCTCIPDGIAISGVCKSDCSMLWPYAVLCFLSEFVHALIIAPVFLARIRSVEDRDKSTAVGITAFSLSLLGLMPAPIIMGKVIDTTCLIWQSSCSIKGACLLYDIIDFRIKLHVIVIGYKMLTLIFYSLALWNVRKMIQWPSQLTKNKTLHYETDKVTPTGEGKILINENEKQ